MKDIVVAIDFSKGSVHALEYAIELANITESNIIMVWVDNQSVLEPHITSESAELRDDSKKGLEELANIYRQKLKPGKITFKIRKGKIYQELAAQAKQSECAILITGTHGVTGFEEYWIGSNASRVVAYSPCPVISVKSNYDINRGIRKILLPVDHTPQTIQKAFFTTVFAKHFGADIKILALYTSRLKTLQRVVDNHVARVEKYLSGQSVNYIVDTLITDNLTTAIINHAREEDVDLISIVTDSQNEATATILGQFAQQLVNYSTVPILSIPPKEHFVLA